MATVIAITSGKGGVGKTNVAVNLGVGLAQRGSRVCLLDADTGLANVNILLGMSPRRTIEHVVLGSHTVEGILEHTPWGLDILPGASGVQRCAELPARGRAALVAALRTLESTYDHILIDTAAGVSPAVLDFVNAAAYKIIVITPEPTALTDAFSLLKLALARGSGPPFYLLVNRAEDYTASRRVYGRFQAAVRKYLKLEVNYLGFVADDPALEEAVRQQVPVVVGAPGGRADSCIRALSEIVFRQFLDHAGSDSFSRYWQALASSPAPDAAARDRGDGISPETAVDRLVDYLGSDDASATAAARLLEPLLAAYDRRCPSRSPSVAGDLFGELHRRGYPEAEIKELILTLEGIYEKTQGRPVRNPESVAALLISDPRTTADGIRWLRHVLDTVEERTVRKR